MKRSESIKEISKALSLAQSEVKIATYDSQNPHFKSKYASLTSVWEACRIPLSKNNLSVVQSLDHLQNDPKSWTLVTLLMHSSGEWIEGMIPIIITKQDMQGLGSAITYAKRYALSSLIGIASDNDDDGHIASFTPKTESQNRTLEKPIEYSSPGDYVIRAKKFQGLKLKTLERKEIENYLKWIGTLSDPPMDQRDFLKYATKYLSELNNTPPPQDDSDFPFDFEDKEERVPQ